MSAVSATNGLATVGGSSARSKSSKYGKGENYRNSMQENIPTLPQRKGTGRYSHNRSVSGSNHKVENESKSQNDEEKIISSAQRASNFRRNAQLTAEFV